MARFAMWGLVALVGLGIVVRTQPLWGRIPLLGPTANAGMSILPGRSQQMTTDQWGRAR